MKIFLPNRVKFLNGLTQPQGLGWSKYKFGAFFRFIFVNFMNKVLRDKCKHGSVNLFSYIHLFRISTGTQIGTNLCRRGDTWWYAGFLATRFFLGSPPCLPLDHLLRAFNMFHIVTIQIENAISLRSFCVHGFLAIRYVIGPLHLFRIYCRPAY